MSKKRPTLREKVQQYEMFLHAINLGIVCNNTEMVRELVGNADRWSYMHRVGEGIGEKEREDKINGAFWDLCQTPKADLSLLKG
jgi:hypothetical protein